MQQITIEQMKQLPRDRYNFIIFPSHEEALRVYDLVTVKGASPLFLGYRRKLSNIPLIRIGHPQYEDDFCPGDVEPISGKSLEVSILYYYPEAIVEEYNLYFYIPQQHKFKEL